MIWWDSELLNEMHAKRMIPSRYLPSSHPYSVCIADRDVRVDGQAREGGHAAGADAVVSEAQGLRAGVHHRTQSVHSLFRGR